MKKKLMIALAGAFVFFLVLGIILHSRQGLYFQDNFWTLKKDGRFAGPNGAWVRSNGDGSYAFSFGGETLSAQKSTLSDGGVRMDYSDGWAVEHGPSADYFMSEFGAYAWTSDTKLILTDADAQGFEFAAAAGSESYPFYDGEGSEPIGETIHIMSADGETLDVSEIWYHQPEFNTPEKQVVVLEDGAVIPSGDCVFQNSEGEYLLNTHALGSFTLGTEYSYHTISRSSWSYFLLHLDEDRPETRGNIPAFLIYILFYGMGAAQIILPDQMAFFGSRWRFKGEPELSDEGRSAVLIGGGIIMLCGIIMLFAGL